MKAKENEGKKLFIIFILLVVTYSIGIIGMVSATPADPGHGAPAIGPGTFEGGFYVFPNNLSVTQNFSVDTNTLYVDSVLHRIGIGTTSPGYLLEIHNASNALNVSDILFVSGQTGRVGIGTAGPDVLLHLIDTVAATPTILFEGGSNDIGWDSAQNLQFSTWDGTTAFVKMTIRSDGKVGIGIVNPEDKLSVSGTINGTDIVCDGGGCINAVELNSDVAGLGLNTTSGVLAVNILSPGGGILVSNDQVVLNQSCDDGQVLKWDDDNSVWNCSSDIGMGSESDPLSLHVSGGSNAMSQNIDMNDNSIQDLANLYKDDSSGNFFSGSCSDNEYITGISAAGAISCGTDTGNISRITTTDGSSGLDGGCIEGTCTLTVDVTDIIDTSTGGLTETSNDIQVNAGDGIDVSTDVDVDVTDLIASGQGVEEIATNNIGLNQSCTDGQVLKWDNSNSVWNCSSDIGMGSESDPLSLHVSGGSNAMSQNIDMNDNSIQDLANLYKDDSSGNFFSGSCSDNEYITGISAAGAISCSSDTGTGTMSSWILGADSGTQQTISQGDTANITAGTGITTVVGATDKVTISADCTDILGHACGSDNVDDDIASCANVNTCTVSADQTKCSGTHEYLDGTDNCDVLSDLTNFTDAGNIYQEDITGSCSGANFVQSIANGGTISCGSEVGDIEGITTADGSSGLDGGCTSGTCTLTVDVTDIIDTSTGGLTETSNDIQVNAGDGIDVSTDVDVDVTDLIASNKGLAEIATNNIGLLQTCGNGQVLKSGASNNWACADDDSGAGGWSVSGTYVYNDTSAVTVGIGNNTPITKLAISSPSDQLGIIDSDGSQEWRLSANSNMLYIEDENTGAIPFKIEDGADTDTLIIDDAGHVGIGKTGPTYTLDANGTIRSKPTSGDGVILIENSGGTQVLRIDQNSIRTTTNNDITIFTNGNSGQLFLDQGTGNVGIGNTGPDTELHIQGGLCVDTDAACTDPGDGNVYVEGNATITGTYFGAATDAPDTYIWSISPTYPNYGIYFNEGSPDYIEFKSAGSATSWIALDNGNAQFSDLTLSGGDLSFSANGGCASSVAMCQSGGDTTIRGGGGGDVIVQLG